MLGRSHPSPVLDLFPTLTLIINRLT